MEKNHFYKILSTLYVLSESHNNIKWMQNIQKQINDIFNNIKDETSEEINVSNYFSILSHVINTNLSENWYKNECERNILLYLVKQYPRNLYEKEKDIIEKYHIFLSLNLNEKEYEYEYEYDDYDDKYNKEEEKNARKFEKMMDQIQDYYD